jgi:hypothetical protein
MSEKFKSFRCCNEISKDFYCGGKVILSGGKNRWREEFHNIRIKIPDDWLIATCQSCGEEYSDIESSFKLSVKMTEILTSSITKNIEFWLSRKDKQ